MQTTVGSTSPAAGAHAPAVSPEVAAALAGGRPVVALESTLLAHGLPRPENRQAADYVEAAVRAGGAVPATIAVLDGVAHIGLTATEVDRVCGDPDLAKLGVRDLPVAAALGRSGATTVSSTALLAAQTGIAVFATGGLGGVHRQAGDTFDESADLVALARTSLVVVANPLPPDEQLAPDVHDRVIAEALAAAEAAGVRGKDVAPFLLDHLHRSSAGASLAVNVRLVLRNAELAGQIAVELAALPR